MRQCYLFAAHLEYVKNGYGLVSVRFLLLSQKAKWRLSPENMT